MTKHYVRHGASLLTLAGLMAVSLAACNKPAPAPVDAVTGLPLVAGPATAEAAAPPPAALPPAPQPIAAHWRADPGRYAYLDDAYGMSDAFGDAPPDYAFDYDGVEPWAWRGGDGSRRFAEPVSGGYRYYYYRAGASRPYLVRDPSYAYGYDGDQLVVVYDGRGRPLSQAEFDRQSDAAGRYLNRARALAAAADANRRRSVVAANWAARQSQITAQRSAWAEQQAQDADWRAYHQSHAQHEDSRWADERRQRQAAAAGFNNWRQTNFTGAPPPPAWTPPRAGGPAAATGPGPHPGEGDRPRGEGHTDEGRQGPPPPLPQPAGPAHNAQQDAVAAQQALAHRVQADHAPGQPPGPRSPDHEHKPHPKSADDKEGDKGGHP